MRIEINLATQPYEDARQFWTYWGTGVGVLALVTVLLASLAVMRFLSAQRERKEIADMEAIVARFDQEKAQAESVLNQPQNRAIRDRSRFLNELFERKAFSWTRVFEDLEQVMPAHLHVVSVQPDVSADNGVAIKLVVGGDNSEQARDLVRKMEASKRFKDTRIDSERSAENADLAGGDRVTFDITALYEPSAESAAASGGMR